MTASLKPPLTALALDAIPPALEGGVVAIGNFDGVHRGHAELLRASVAGAKARGRRSLVLSFEPHPRTFFKPSEPVFRLTPLPVRERLLAAVGIDGLVVANFDAALAGTSAESFIDDVLVDRLHVGGVVVGEGFRFGHRRAGTIATLATAAATAGFDLLTVPPVIVDGKPVSSTAIRALLAAGDIASANALLGYTWFVTGTVIEGERRGRELGFPTANLRLSADCRLAHGIYAVRLTRDGETFDGVASYGRRPTFDNGAPLLEVFVFDFSGDLYGAAVAVAFEGWIRPEARFASVPDLIAAMNEDAANAKDMLARPGPGTPLDRALSGVAVVTGGRPG